MLAESKHNKQLSTSQVACCHLIIIVRNLPNHAVHVWVGPHVEVGMGTLLTPPCGIYLLQVYSCAVPVLAQSIILLLHA